MARDMAAAQGLDPGRFLGRGLVDRRVHTLARMLDEPGLLEALERQDGRCPRPPPEPDEVGEARARVGAHHREQGLVRLDCRPRSRRVPALAWAICRDAGLRLAVLAAERS